MILCLKLGTVRDEGPAAPLHDRGQSTPATYEGASAPRHVQHSHGVAEAQGTKPAVTGSVRQAGSRRTRSSTWRENARVLTPRGGDRTGLPAEPQSTSGLPGKADAAVSSASEKAAVRTWNTVSPLNGAFELQTPSSLSAPKLHVW